MRTRPDTNEILEAKARHGVADFVRCDPQTPYDVLLLRTAEAKGLIRPWKLGADGVMWYRTIGASSDEPGKPSEPRKKPSGGVPRFTVVAYNGGPLQLGGWDHSVVADFDTMQFGNSLIANLDHDSSRRVGHITHHSTACNRLAFEGLLSAATESKREVLESSQSGFPFQASIEAGVDGLKLIGDRETARVNGQVFEGPFYRAATTIKGFAFVSHGADDTTTVSISASWFRRKNTGLQLGEVASESDGDQVVEIVDVNRRHELEANGNPFVATFVSLDDEGKVFKCFRNRLPVDGYKSESPAVTAKIGKTIYFPPESEITIS